VEADPSIRNTDAAPSHDELKNLHSPKMIKGLIANLQTLSVTESSRGFTRDTILNFGWRR